LYSILYPRCIHRLD
jgi:hypothetical protein